MTPNGPPPSVAPSGGQFSAPTRNSTSFQPATWQWRVKTTAIDYLPVLAIFLISWLLFGRPGWGPVVEYYGEPPRPYYTMGQTPASLNLLLPILLSSIFCLFNKGWLEGTTGQSIGKKFLGYRTQDMSTGEVLGTKRASIRWLLLNIDIAVCLIGIAWPLWDIRRQTLVSDRLTESVVVKA